MIVKWMMLLLQEKENNKKSRSNQDESWNQYASWSSYSLIYSVFHWLVPAAEWLLCWSPGNCSAMRTAAGRSDYQGPQLMHDSKGGKYASWYGRLAWGVSLRQISRLFDLFFPTNRPEKGTISETFRAWCKRPRHSALSEIFSFIPLTVKTTKLWCDHILNNA